MKPHTNGCDAARLLCSQCKVVPTLHTTPNTRSGLQPPRWMPLTQGASWVEGWTSHRWPWSCCDRGSHGRPVVIAKRCTNVCTSLFGPTNKTHTAGTHTGSNQTHKACNVARPDAGIKMLWALVESTLPYQSAW